MQCHVDYNNKMKLSIFQYNNLHFKQTFLFTISVCYYCHSNYLDSFLGQKKLAEKLCCMLCWPILLPPGKYLGHLIPMQPYFNNYAAGRLL